MAGLAAAIAVDKRISIRNIQVAAKDYFLRDKEGKISKKAQDLLDKIVRDCIRRETRVLVLRRPSESDNPLVQALYDNRLIHRVEQGSCWPRTPRRLTFISLISAASSI
jgi:hypothetical protein